MVKNIEREGPGLLQPILDAHNISVDIVENPTECPSPVGYKAVLVYGGPDSANDETEKMQTELSRIKEALDNQIPYLGICLGMQALVKAAGGSVVRAGEGMASGDSKEVGFIDPNGVNYGIVLHAQGKKDPLFAGLPAQLGVFQLHSETVLLNTGMNMLALGEFCLAQAVRVGKNAYGIQSHFELTPEMLGVWAREDPDLQPIGEETLKKQFAAIQYEYTKTGEKLFTNFLKIAGLTD